MHLTRLHRHEDLRAFIPHTCRELTRHGLELSGSFFGHVGFLLKSLEKALFVAFCSLSFVDRFSFGLGGSDARLSFGDAVF